MSYDLAAVLTIYTGSDGDRTKALYDHLQGSLGIVGEIAVNLFRAMKNSERAKGYRRRSSKGGAYDTKGWAMQNLCVLLEEHAEDAGITWGWRADPMQPHYPWVLYVDLPTGQVSFHTASRGMTGPDYDKPWDGVTKQGPSRLCAWIAGLLRQVQEAEAA